MQMIQGGTDNTPISAIPAAIASNTELLLGLWASAGQQSFNQELTALKSAIQQYPGLGKLVTGISVGSEDLYRITDIGKENDPSGVGAGPGQLSTYIGEVRNLIKGTSLSAAPVGHVDTWVSTTSKTSVKRLCANLSVTRLPGSTAATPKSSTTATFSA